MLRRTFRASACFDGQIKHWRDAFLHKISVTLRKCLVKIIQRGHYKEHFYQFEFDIKELFTWREEDSSTRKFVEGGTTFRLLYMQKFRPE